MGGKGSGGHRPSASQNQTGVSATGGAGSASGQPNQQYTGMPYGQNKQVNDQQASAPMAGNPVPSTTAVPINPLLSPTERPNEPITHGVDVGPGAGSEVLPNVNADTRLTENQQIISKYIPLLQQAAGMQDTPDSFKRFVNYLIGQQ